jgi:hypothetical protein
MEIFAQAQNVLNHVSPTGYTGNMSSQFFGVATGVSQARDLNVGRAVQLLSTKARRIRRTRRRQDPRRVVR